MSIPVGTGGPSKMQCYISRVFLIYELVVVANSYSRMYRCLDRYSVNVIKRFHGNMNVQ